MGGERAASLRESVLRVREANLATYGSKEQRASIMTAVARSFTLAGVFLFELVQNALDVGATRVRVEWDETHLILEHNATELFDEPSISALSKLGMSTKRSLDTVGFMGLGFKSVFQRFERVEVSDPDLRMFFEVAYDEGAYGDRHKRWIDLVLPSWDEGIAPPSAGYTTRFRLVRPLPERTVADDVTEFVPDDEGVPHALAILALRGLREVVVGAHTWKLSVQTSGTGEIVTASDAVTTVWWLVVRQAFRPSKSAIRRLLEHRDLKLDAETDELTRDREVVLLVPVDSREVPCLQDTGQIFATLPTGVELKLPVLLQADWLLNAGRDGLIDPGTDPWQREIVAQIPLLLRRLLIWIRDAARRERDALRGLDVLAALGPGSSDLGGALARPEVLAALTAALADVDFVPVYPEGKEGIATAKAGDVADVPPELLPPFQDADDLAPSLIFGGPLLHREFAARPAVTAALRHLRLLKPVTLEHLRRDWPSALNEWWGAVTQVPPGADADIIERRAATAAHKVMAAVQRLRSRDDGWAQLACVLTTANAFVAPHAVVQYAYSMPGSDDELGVALRDHLPGALLAESVTLHPALRPLVVQQKSEDAAAARELLSLGKTVQPHELIRAALNTAAAAGSVDPSVVVLIAAWARERKQPGVLSYMVVTDSDGRDVLAPAAHAVVADPFVEGGDARRVVFADRRPVSALFLTRGAPSDWRAFLESVPGVAGPLRLVESSERVPRWNESRFEELTGLKQRSTSDYEVFDLDFEPGVQIAGAGPAFARWLEAGYTQLRGTGTVSAGWFYYTPVRKTKARNAARWIRRLADEAWVPVQGGGQARPCDVVAVRETDDQPLAAISFALVRALETEGLRFGTAVPRPGPLTRLRARGGALPAAELAAALRDAIAAASSQEDQRELRDAVMDLAVPIEGAERVPVRRLVLHVLGGKYRSDLRGFVVTFDKVDPVVRSELVRVPNLVVPPTTTGEQALAFLRGVWRQASLDRVEREVVRVLPTAYGYLATDVAGNPALQAGLDTARDAIRVSDGRGWHEVGARPGIVVDDLHDDDLRALLEPGTRTASAWHLGERAVDVARVARLLRLPLLSEVLQPTTTRQGTLAPPWLPRLKLLCAALATLEGRVELDVEVNASIETVARGQSFPRRATTIEGRLHVAGTPQKFCFEAARKIVAHYRLEQRGDDVPVLVETIAELPDADEFRAALGRLAQVFQLDGDAVATLASSGDIATPIAGTAPAVAAPAPEREDAVVDQEHEPAPTTTADDEHAGSRDESAGDERTDHDADGHEGSAEQADDDEDVDVTAHTRGRRGGGHHSDEVLPRAGYGYGTRAHKDTDRSAQETNDEDEDADDDRDETPAWPDDATGPDARRRYVVADPRASRRTRARDRQAPDDGPARAAVIAFERDRGRVPKAMGDKHEGYDVESLDPTTERIRRIEIKTIAGIWRDEASVYLSEPQFRAGAMNRDPGLEHWLYVVDAHRIYPVPWRSVVSAA